MFVTQICIPKQELGNEDDGTRYIRVKYPIAIAIDFSISIPRSHALRGNAYQLDVSENKNFRSLRLPVFCSYSVYPSRGY